MEHSPVTLESARNMILATQGTRLVPIIHELGLIAAGSRSLLEAAGKTPPDTKNRPLY